jgi:tape measure domain-containing protein
MRQLDKQANSGVQSKAYKRAEADIKRANNALVKMRNNTQMANAAAREGAAAYAVMGSQIGRAGSAIGSLESSSSSFLQSLASGVWLAKRFADALEKVTSLADDSRSQVARLGLYNTSQYSNEEIYGQVFSTAMRTRTGLSDTADLVNKLLLSGVFSGPDSAMASVSTASIINKALVAGGGTNEQNQRALLQLTQGLASGQLQGDELRSIREQAPYLAKTLAEGLAQVDSKFEGIGIGDLKELGAQGELTSDRIVKAMWAMQDEVDEAFSAMPRTFGQATTSLSNIWQYFLWLLSGADGPLGKINERLWQFVEYLQSPQGFELMESVAIGINFVTTAISGAMGAVGDFVVFLQENVPIAQALFIALGAAAVVAGISAAAAWIAATWPILLVMTLVGLLAYYFLSTGYTAQEVVGAIAGGVMWLVAIIWNSLMGIVMLLMWAAYLIIASLMYIGAAALEVVMGIVQIIIWAVMIIITVVWAILATIKTVFLLIETVIRGVIVGIVSAFYGLAQAVLSVLETIAKGIDWIFGSNLADTVSGWSTSLEGTYTAFVEETDPSKSLEEIGTTWEDFGAGVEEMFTSDDYNLYGEMGALWDGTVSADNAMYDLLNSGTDFMGGLMVDPGAWYDSGSEWGAGLVDEVGALNLGLPDGSLGVGFDPSAVQIDGGYLDGIKGDVDISDEDIQLLRDMAARDYLLQLQSITPVAHVTFGDVRETADVNKIVEVIESMVEEQMATSLVS